MMRTVVMGLMLASMPVMAGAADTSKKLDADPVSLPYAEQFTLASQSVDDAFRIYVGLPPGYDAASKQRYPVLYVLDANGLFGTALETVHVALPSGQLPEMIVVGIGYPLTNFKQTWGLRMRDYAPVGDPEHFYAKMVERMLPPQPASIHSGGAGRFLKFIREELQPLINSRYRTNPQDTAIFGDSLGGTFALYTLFTAPDTFARYAIGSPAVSWGNGFLYEQEKRYAAGHKSLPARVYMSVGANEGPGVSEVLRMAAAVTDRRYQQLKLKVDIFDQENHISVIPLNISRGLREAFCDPPRETGCGNVDSKALSEPAR